MTAITTSGGRSNEVTRSGSVGVESRIGEHEAAKNRTFQAVGFTALLGLKAARENRPGYR
jgi:hypothetical protein